MSQAELDSPFQGRGPLRAVQQMSWRYPHWWAGLAAAIAWVPMVAAGRADPSHLLGGDHPAHPLGEAFLHSSVMAVAMMLPLALPAVRHVAFSSLWYRRHRSAVGFLVGYLVVWVVVATVLVVGGERLIGYLGYEKALAGMFAAAGLWQLAPGKRCFLSRCKLTVPLAPAGWEADRDCMRLGFLLGCNCVATCWALMAATAASHGLVSMGGVFAVELAERFSFRFHAVPTAVAVLAIGFVAIAGPRLAY